MQENSEKISGLIGSKEDLKTVCNQLSSEMSSKSVSQKSKFNQKMESFKLIGLKLKGKTKNENGQSGKDCGELWQHFEVNKIAELIPNKISDSIYAVYYDYESDENGLFSYFIGCKVEENAETPKGLDEIIIPKQNYHKETAKGQMTGCISETWTKIWNSNINRKYGFDFEIYDERSYDWNNAEIDIFLSIND